MIKKLTIYLVLSLIVFGGCEKDKTKPEETQPTKESLLCRTWQLDKEYINGEENLSMINMDYEYKRDGTGISIIYFVQAVTINFEWRWADNQESIEIMVLDSKSKSAWDKVDIIVLTENKLIIEQLIGEKQYRMEFTEK